MTAIYLIRHAEAEGNLYRIVQGQRDSTLTDRGWLQVRALQRRFEGVRVDAVYSSDLYRARATATAIAKPRRLQIQGVPDLREICVGDWEELTFGEIRRRDPVMLENFGRHMDLWRVNGAESPRGVLDRAWNFLNAVAPRHDGQTIALVSHGYILRLLLCKIQGLTLEETGAVAHGDNTAVSLLEYDNGAFRVAYRDDNRHLQTPELTRVKRKNALEAGLWFREASPDDPLFHAFAADALRESGRAFDLPTLLSGAPGRSALVAFLGDAPAGLLQLGPDSGWMSIVYMKPEYRKQGLGIQLVGQAVMRTRRGGGEFVRTAAPPDAAFFPDYGFVLSDTLPDSRAVWQKDIRFPPI